MDKDEMAALARIAGLQQALADFREDVAAAAAQAHLHRGIMPAPGSPTALSPSDEPWPPMRTAQ